MNSRHGSTVYAGGYECECFNCYEYRRIGSSGNVATWSSWRIRGRGLATWILCDECLPKSQALDEDPTSVDDPNVAHLYLPLLSPSDPYAAIAVEEMLYALTALVATVRERASRRFVLDVAPRHGKSDAWWKSRAGR